MKGSNRNEQTFVRLALGPETPPLCGRCNAIDRELIALQRWWAEIKDDLALSLLNEAAKYLQSEKAALHPAMVSRAASEAD